LLGVDLRYDDVDRATRLKRLTRNAFVADSHQTFDARLELHVTTVPCDRRDMTLQFTALVVSSFDLVPRVLVHAAYDTRRHHRVASPLLAAEVPADRGVCAFMFVICLECA
jgi:hypothetical protein